MEDNQKLEELFGQVSGETYAYDTSGDTLVDMSKLFEKIDFDKVDKIVQDSEKIKRRDAPSKYSRRKGIINEDYLRDLIRDEVMSALDDVMDELLEQISYSIERLVATPKPAMDVFEDEQLNENTEKDG
jgi:galactokinase